MLHLELELALAVWHAEICYNQPMASVIKSRSYTVHIEPAHEGGFWARVPSLPGCYSQGETVEETVANIKEAIQLYIEDIPENDIPEESELSMSIRVPVR